jgi:hypothetical protein
MKLVYLIAVIMSVGIVAGCNTDVKKDSTNHSTATENFLAGDNQKTWMASKETNSEGDKQEVDRAEKNELITFFTNGNFTMGDPAQSRQGTYTYDGNNLMMQFEGESVSENFTVLELDKNSLKLRAADGSEMTMKPK